jgi:hypothetical protein
MIEWPVSLYLIVQKMVHSISQAAPENGQLDGLANPKLPVFAEPLNNERVTGTFISHLE